MGTTNDFGKPPGGQSESRSRHHQVLVGFDVDSSVGKPYGRPILLSLRDLRPFSRRDRFNNNVRLSAYDFLERGLEGLGVDIGE